MEEITLKLTSNNKKIIETYAKYNKQDILHFINDAIKEKIEDTYGVIVCKEILKNKKNLKTRPYSELRKEALSV